VSGVDRDARLTTFAAFPERLARAATTVERPPPAGEWGPIEVVRHLIAVEDEVHQRRLREIAIGDEPRWVWTEPGLAEGYVGAPLERVLDAFARARAETVSTLRQLDEAGWARAGTHDTYGRLDVDGLVRLASDHDDEHLAWSRESFLSGTRGPVEGVLPGP
jgi:hypothetical protein